MYRPTTTKIFISFTVVCKEGPWQRIGAYERDQRNASALDGSVETPVLFFAVCGPKFKLSALVHERSQFATPFSVQRCLVAFLRYSRSSFEVVRNLHQILMFCVANFWTGGPQISDPILYIRVTFKHCQNLQANLHYSALKKDHKCTKTIFRLIGYFYWFSVIFGFFKNRRQFRFSKTAVSIRFSVNRLNTSWGWLTMFCDALWRWIRF